MSEEVLQIWVRNEKGKVFGPLTPTSVELLLDNGVIEGRVQVSLDGSNYVFPGRMPGIRMVFPKTLWGDQVLPPNELDEAWSKVVAPPPLPTVAAAKTGAAPGGPVGVPGGPVPGGAVPGGPVPRAGPMAGPGARAQQQARPMNPAQLSAQKRPSPAHAAPAPSGGSLADSLFGEAAPSGPTATSPSGVRMVAPPSAPKAPVMSASAISAAMGSAPPLAPVSSPSRPAVSAPSQVQAAPSAPAMEPPPAPVPQSAPAVAALERVPASGTLRDVSPLRLYFLAAAQDLNGLLTFQLPDRAILLHFRKGSPDFVDSTHPEDALATFLLRQRLVGPEQLGQAQKEGARFGGELLPALFGLGLLNPNAALDALNQRIAGLIGQALRATDGSFTLQGAELPAQKAMPAGNRWQLYVEQLRKIPTIELKARLHGALDFPVMKASGPVPVAELRLSPQETRAYAGFDGTRTLNQLLQSGAPEAEHAVRVAFMLEPCDLVSFAGTVVKTAVPPRPVAPPPAPVAPPPAVAPPAGPARPVITPQGSAPVAPAPAANPVAPAPAPVAPAVPRPPGVPGNPVMVKPPSYPGGPAPVVSPARPPAPVASTPSGVVVPPSAPAPNAAQFDAEVKRLTDVLAKMKTQTHFEVLALTKDSPANAVKIAYFKLAKDYHPDTVPPGAPAALSKVKADIFARIGDANRTLADENLRKEYLAELEHGGTGEKVDVSKLLQAEEYFQKGKILVNARKFPEAVKMLDDAIALVPDDAEVYAWRGYARFYTFPDKKAGFTEAMKDIQSCLKRNPNIVPAHFFQGMMNKVLGDVAAAKKHFSATVKLDPKHIDAQRELRMMK